MFTEYNSAWNVENAWKRERKARRHTPPLLNKK